MSLSVTSNYIYQRSSERFGNQQESYITRSQEIIHSLAANIRENVSQKEDLSTLFFQLLDRLGEERKQIAIDTQTKGADQFGLRRDLEEFFIPESREYYTTPLHGVYQNYNDRLVKKIQDALSSLKHDLKGFSETKFEQETTFNGKNSKFVVEVLDQDELQKRGISTPLDNREILACSNTNSTTITKTLFKEFKRQQPKRYQADKVFVAISTLQKKFPSPIIVPMTEEIRSRGVEEIKSKPGFTYEGETKNLKSHFILVTNRQQIGEKLYCLTQYITWTYFTYKEDPVTRMQDRSVVLIIHHDPFLLPDTLKYIATVFEKAVLWDQKDIEEYKDSLALFHYLFAHASPYHRGSSAICEWLLSAVSQVHNLPLKFDSNHYGDLDAITSSSFKEFREKYDEIVHLN